MSKKIYDPEPITEIIRACAAAGVIEFKLGDLHISFGKAQSVATQLDKQPAELPESPQGNYNENYNNQVLRQTVLPLTEDKSDNDFEYTKDSILEEELRLSELKLTDPYAYELKQLEDEQHGEPIQ